MKAWSIRQRLLLLLGLLPLLLLLMAWVLKLAHDESLRQSNQARLEATLYGLMRDTQFVRGELMMPEYLPEPVFNSEGGDAAARVLSADGRVLWESRSAVLFGGLPASPDAPPATRFEYQENLKLEGLLLNRLRRRVHFGADTVGEGAATEGMLLDYEVWQRSSALSTSREAFLWPLWMGALAVALVVGVAVLVILHWVSAPLKAVRNELDNLRQGRQGEIEGEYPSEIRQLVMAINELLQSERRQRERVRQRLADLAHSLKTPLTVIRGELQSREAPSRKLLTEESERLAHLVDLQLKRAAGSGATWKPTVAIRPVIDRLLGSLDRIYPDPQREVCLQIPEGAAVAVDEDDLMEIFGNLLENACKYGGKQICVSLKVADASQSDQDGASRAERWSVSVSDNGPGIPLNLFPQVLERGVRADERPIGHGVGLAIVTDLLEQYRSALELAHPQTGGLTLTFELPGF